MSEQNHKFYLTTPIYYVNARPHIGHAYTTIVADVLARRHRLLGDDTFFLTGTDEHGQKIERSAAAAGIPPQQFADQVSKQFRDLWDRMGLTYDGYIRTTDEKHKRGVQKLFTELYNNGFIYLSTYTGAYCVSDEAFVDLPVGTPCPDCGRPLEQVTEENFFFKLSEFQAALLEEIYSDRLKIEPQSAQNEVLSFLSGAAIPIAETFQPKESSEEAKWTLGMGLEEGARRGLLKTISVVKNGERKTLYYVPGVLKDLSISRSSFTWGIPVPAEVQKESSTTQNHVIYVWLDALTNYMTAIGYGSDQPADVAQFEKYWPADLHLVGKEITRFHCVYWPAFLLAAKLPLPKQITANGWLLFDNAKMSKSKGNVVRTETILEGFGEHVYGKQFPDSSKPERDLFASDVLRYFLLREIPFGQDGSFSFDALITRYNADLVNGYGNLVSRVLQMRQQYGALIIAEPDLFIQLARESAEAEMKIEHEKISALINGFLNEFDPLLERTKRLADLTAYSEAISTLVRLTDGLLAEAKPWVSLRNAAAHGMRGETSFATFALAISALQRILSRTTQAIRTITVLLHPILPFSTDRVWSQLGLGTIAESASNGEFTESGWTGLKPGTKLEPSAYIFPRADKGLAQIMIDMENENARPSEPLKSASTPAPTAHVSSDPTHPAAPPRALDEPSGTLPVAGSDAVTTERVHTPHSEAQASGVFASEAAKTPVNAGPSDASPQITIDDFAKVELRVAQVIVCERIPKADKLLRLEVDLGYEKRQILSGIAEWYTPEDLIGRRIVVITNLAPRKMRGLESHGMLLAASEEGGKPVLATFGEDIALGARLK